MRDERRFCESVLVDPVWLEESAGDDLSDHLSSAGIPHRRQRFVPWPTELALPGVVVIDGRRMDHQDIARVIDLNTSPNTGRIVVAGHGPFEEELRVPSAYVPASHLPATTWRFLDQAWRADLKARVALQLGIPFLVRATLATIISETSIAVSAIRPRPVRNLSKISEDLGVSRAHLSRTITPLMDVHAIADQAMVVQAVWMMAAYGHSWDRIAWTLGYRTLSGLHRLMQRVIGAGLRDTADQEPIDLGLRWEALLLSQLAEARARTDRSA